jgi:hypothetical protein
VAAPADVSLAKAWKDALNVAQSAAQKDNFGCFWYIRRRQLPYFSEISGVTLRLAGDARALDAEFIKRMNEDGTAAAFDAAATKLPRLAVTEAVSLLANPRLAVSTTLPDGVLKTSDLLRRSAFTAITAVAESSDQPTYADVLTVVRRFGAPELGAGFDALALTAPNLLQAAAVDTIARSGVAPELDAAARQLPEAAQKDFAAKLAELAVNGKVDDVRNLAPKTGDSP